jgi:hypothetical protein
MLNMSNFLNIINIYTNMIGGRRYGWGYGGKHYWFRYLDINKMEIIDKAIVKMAIDLGITPPELRALICEVVTQDPEINAKVTEKIKEILQKYKQQ